MFRVAYANTSHPTKYADVTRISQLPYSQTPYCGFHFYSGRTRVIICLLISNDLLRLQNLLTICHVLKCITVLCITLNIRTVSGKL